MDRKFKRTELSLLINASFIYLYVCMYLRMHVYVCVYRYIQCQIIGDLIDVFEALSLEMLVFLH